jgi:hypothetical protein
MKNITLKAALTLINRAHIVQIDGETVNTSVDDVLTGDAENQVAGFTWDDGEGQEFQVIVREGENKGVKRDVNLLYMIDSEGEPLVLELFTLAPLKD